MTTITNAIYIDIGKEAKTKLSMLARAEEKTISAKVRELISDYIERSERP